MQPTKPYLALLTILALLGAGLSTVAVSAPAEAAPTSGSVSGSAYSAPTGTTYYVSPTGSDSAAGTSRVTAWRTLARASRAQLAPGDRLRLRGGATYAESGGLTVGSGGWRSRPVLVDGWGAGLPAISGASGSCLTVRGDWVVVRDLVVKNCGWAGVELDAAHDVVRRVHAWGSVAGVHVSDAASYAWIAHSSIRSNTKMNSGTSGGDDDSGAFGILVNGDHTTVISNYIYGQDAPSADYGRDGSAVEVFGASGTTVEYNVGNANQTFVEVGGVPGRAEVDGLMLYRNTVGTTSNRTFFLVVHAGDSFGRAQDVVATSNAATLTGQDSAGVVCGPKCTSDVLQLHGNAIVAGGQPVEVYGG